MISEPRLSVHPSTTDIPRLLRHFRNVPKPEAGEIDTNCIGGEERAANAAFKT
jgi:hypothetical protein